MFHSWLVANNDSHYRQKLSQVRSDNEEYFAAAGIVAICMLFLVNPLFVLLFVPLKVYWDTVLNNREKSYGKIINSIR